MFAIQARYQSTEKGSRPLGGEPPWTSLYRRSSRSRLRLTSASMNCSRAPSPISVIASCTSCMSCRMLLPLMACARWPPGLLLVDAAADHGVVQALAVRGLRLDLLGDRVGELVVGVEAGLGLAEFDALLDVFLAVDVLHLDEVL